MVAVARLPQNRHVGVAEARLHVVVWIVVVPVLLHPIVLELGCRCVGESLHHHDVLPGHKDRGGTNSKNLEKRSCV